MTSGSQYEQERLQQLAQEAIRRRRESLRIFRPMPSQMPFFTSRASERLVRGGNRSGKSTAAAISFASAATGATLIGCDGNPIPNEYPTDRPLTLWIVGYDSRHIGMTIYRLLFMPGLFLVIKDPHTGEWRAWDPTQKWDAANRLKCRPSPPLIPKRYIDPAGWAWESKPDREFTVCRLHPRDKTWESGTSIHAFSSKGDPKQGDPVDVIWIDEDIRFPKHVSEWESRLSDRKGRLIWSAFPHSKNDALVRMSYRAEEQKDRENPDVEETLLTFSGNPYMDADEKRKRTEGWTDEEVAARDRGEFLTDSVLVYPTFAQDVHGVGRGIIRTEIDTFLAARGFTPPWDWTNFLSIDPGHSTSAALFFSVPPPEFGDFIVLWNEVYLKRAHADLFATDIKRKTGKRPFEAFIMDAHAGRQTPMGYSGRTIFQHYADAFRKAGLSSSQTGNNFFPGNDNVFARMMQVRDLLTIRADGTPKLKFCVENIPETLKEFRMYRKSVSQDEVTDKPVDAYNHAMNALEYACSFPMLQYVAPKGPYVGLSPGYAAFKRWQGENSKNDVVYCGAGVPETNSGR